MLYGVTEVGLVPNKWQAITWTNVNQDPWCNIDEFDARLLYLQC